MRELIQWKMEFQFVLLLCIAAAPFVLSDEPEVSYDDPQDQDDGLDLILSTPEECLRECKDNEAPKTCYYHFTLEMYTVAGGACQLCTANASNTITSECQCVLADGVERGMLTANRMFPGPAIQVCKGDKVVIDVQNNINGAGVTLHWHGVFQKGSQYYDGVPDVTQCAIPERTTFRYQWLAGNAGTHFWHAHTGSQKLDGLQGGLVIREPISTGINSLFYDQDRFDHVMHLSDWMHVDTLQRFPGLWELGQRGQAAANVLINGKGQYTDPKTNITTDVPLEVFTVIWGIRYRFRLVNSFATVCPAILTVENHSLTVIASDGEPITPVVVNSIISLSGERYDFIINANKTVASYWIQLRTLSECSVESVQNLAILRYEGGLNLPRTTAPKYKNGLPFGITLNSLDGLCDKTRSDAICVNQLKSAKNDDEGINKKEADVKIYLPYRLQSYTAQELFVPDTYKTYLVNEGYFFSMLANIFFEGPPSPPISQIDDIPPELFCNNSNRPANCGSDCACTHVYNIKLDDIVEVSLLDLAPIPTLSHPFHLHGHAFSVIGMGLLPATNDTNPSDVERAINLDKQGFLHRQYDRPPSKDTVAVPSGGYTIIQFRADNPGYWLFHCHFTFHIEIGMSVVFHIGEPEDLPPIPPNFPKCGNHLPPITPPV